MVACLLKKILLCALLLMAISSWPALSHAEQGKKILFSGYEWTVKSGRYDPGKNYWSSDNVWVDKDGFLHLKITYRDGIWYCAELRSVESFAYGSYQFFLVGDIDQLDPNMVLGLFVYPAEENPDLNSEIDIEFTRWGETDGPVGNYTLAAAEMTHHFDFSLEGSHTMHQFVWTESQVLFQSFFGHNSKENAKIQQWLYKNEDFAYKSAVPPVRVHLNLWLFKGREPVNGAEKEIVIKKFTFYPYRK